MVGTSLQGHVTATFSELVEAFGLPTFSEPSGDGKVNTEWQLMLGTDAVPATIYDWKDFDGGRRSRDGQSYDWHIGGKSRMAVIAVMEKLNAYRINLMRNVQIDSALEELEAALKSHDWYYNYSDDHGSWQKGNIEEKTISRLMRELLDAGFGEEAAELYNSISPNCDTHRFTHGDKVTVVTVQEGAYHYEFLTEEEYESNGGDL